MACEHLKYSTCPMCAMRRLELIIDGQAEEIEQLKQELRTHAEQTRKLNDDFTRTVIGAAFAGIGMEARGRGIKDEDNYALTLGRDVLGINDDGMEVSPDALAVLSADAAAEE